MYVLDEPSIGLHQRDNDRLLATLKHLRDLGNSVIVVEHDQRRDPVRRSRRRHGAGRRRARRPGRRAGHARRHPARAAFADRPVSGGPSPDPDSGASPSRRRRAACSRSTARTGNNLQNVTLALPVGLFVCVTGVSGSGKSTLINDTLYHAVARHLYDSAEEPAPHGEIDGLEHFDKVISVDQSPIGRTPRSNPATYTGLFTPIRELFAQVEGSARARLRTGALLVQRQGRTLRGVPGRRPHQGRDALPARRLRAVRRLPRASATTARRSRSATRTRTSTKCWR